MFRVTLNISQKGEDTLVRRYRCYKCQFIVVAISLFSVLGLFVTSCYRPRTFLIDRGSNETTNDTSASNNTYKIIGRIGSLDSLEAKAASSYCVIKDCKDIYCSFIPAHFDSGEVASVFIETSFKVDCATITSIRLLFDNCKFPSNAISENWLKTDLAIEGLTLSNCFLTAIHDHAFLPSHFEKMKTFTIINNTIQSLRRSIFKYLPKLKFLTIRDNMVKQVDYDLMASQANTLENLELDGVLDDSEALKNITGGTTLQKLELLSLRRNSLPDIGENVFAGVSKVRSLFLETSEIKTIHPEAFNPMSESIFMLTMSGNSITSLPEGLFDSIVQWNPNFRVSIENNPFHCDCGLKWMQDLIHDYPLVVRTIPECKTPKANHGLSFTRANFCEENDSKPPITNTASTVTEGTTIAGKPVRVLCTNVHSSALAQSISTRRLLWVAELAGRYRGFSAFETEDGNIQVKLPNEQLALLWFESDDPENSLKCVTNARDSYLLKNIKYDTSYTVCLLDEDVNTVSPLNCLVITTNPDYDSSTWLTNADKSLVFFITTASLLSLCLCIAALTFFILRRNPSLLRGSKRVMMVKRRNIDAIVLPKGVTVQSESRKIRRKYSDLHEYGYVTPLPAVPLPPARTETSHRGLVRMDSRVSRISLQSDGHSYVSEVESTIPQMVSWKLKRLKSQIEQRKGKIPPLPPREIPSISSTVRSAENVYTKDAFYTV